MKFNTNLSWKTEKLKSLNNTWLSMKLFSTGKWHKLEKLVNILIAYRPLVLKIKNLKYLVKQIRMESWHLKKKNSSY